MRLGRLAIAAAVSCLLLAGCASSVSPTPSPAALQATPSAAPTVAIPTGSPAGVASGSPGASPGVPVDQGLLAALPATVSGQQVSEVPEIEAQLVADPSLVHNASSLAVALGINMATGDFAYVAVIELKPLVFSNAYYLSWRQSYDQGACSQSSGLKSTASTTIAGRQVFVGTCNGGALTYHVHLAAPDRLISITSVGPANFGQIVLSSLQP